MPNKTYEIGKGIEARMFFPDHNPPHIHVFTGAGMAIIRIADGAVMRGRIKAGDARRVAKWLDGARAELLATWKGLNQ